MGVFAGPDLSESGLVLALDAGNSKGFDDDENLMTNSQLGNTILNDGSGVTLTTDTSIINPFGVYDGVLKCVHTTNTPGYFRRGQNMSLTAGVTYTFSFFFKNGTVVSPYGQSPIYIGVLASTYSPTFQELSQSLNTTISFPDGWYRQVFTFTPGYTQTYQIDFNQANNQTPLGTYYLYGFQLERGLSASPYYATTSTAKNRGTTLIDMTGKGNNGTLTNGPTYSSSNGGSIAFDGTNDQIDTGYYVPGSARSYFVWIKYNKVTSLSGGYALTGTQEVNAYTYVGIVNGGAFYYYGGTTGGTISGTTLNSNIWYQQGLVIFSDGSRKLYLNGVEIYSAAGSVGNTATVPFQIGRVNSGGHFVDGNIAQVQLYNRALTAAEIQQNFNATRGRFGI